MATTTLELMRSNKTSKFAVRIGNHISLEYPDARPVNKNGVLQFWFFHNGRRVLATKTNNDPVFKVN